MGLPRFSESPDTRTNSLILLYEVASAANHARTIHDAVQFVLERVCVHDGWQVGHALMRTGDRATGFVSSRWFHTEDDDRFRRFVDESARLRIQPHQGDWATVLQERAPLWISDPRASLTRGRAMAAEECGLRTGVACPVLVGQQVVAILEFFGQHARQRDPYTIQTLASIGTQLGRIVERTQFDRAIADATTHEQQRIGRELHDGVAQQLAGVSMLAQNLCRRLSDDRPEFAAEAERLQKYVAEAQLQVRRLSRGLVPVEVDADGLTNALEQLAEYYDHTGRFSCRFDRERDVPLEDNRTATHLYRIAQEAASNAFEHSEAQHVSISLQTVGNRLRLEVHDDGCGLDAEQASLADGVGLRIMKHRAGVIGGLLRVESQPDTGTTVVCETTIEHSTEDLEE